jgi:HD-like signal output (HDOD) protein
MPEAPPTLEEVCQRAAALPCSPVLLPRLARAVQQEGTTAEELEQLVLLDPSLAGATLRLANSAYFTHRASAETVGEAIMRLGFREIYKLAASTLASRWLTFQVDGYGWEPGDFCRHSLVVAVAAEQLAADSGRVDKELAYTAGLIHDLGKLAVAFSCGPWFPAIRAHQQAAGCAWWQAEEAVLGFHQKQVGARLLAGWKYPASLVEIARHAERPSAGPPEHRALLAHIHAARFVATSMGPGVAEDGFLFDLDSELLLAEGFSPERLLMVTPEVLERVARLLRDQLTHGAVMF